MEDAQKLIADCGIPVNPEYLQVGNKTACEGDIADLAKLAAEAVKDYEAKNIIALVKVAAQIVKEANKTIEDCKSNIVNFKTYFQVPTNPKINYQQCAKDAYAFAQDCYQFYETVKNGTADLPVVIEELNKMVAAAQLVIDDCGLNFTISDYPPANPGECAADAITLAQLAFQAVNDAKSAQWQAFTTDVVAVLAQGKKTLTDCTSANQTQIEEDNQNLFDCIHSLNTFATDVQTFGQDV